MNIRFNRIFLVLALLSAFYPFVSFLLGGDLPSVVGDTKVWLSMVGDFLSSQMIGIVIAVILFSISRMFEKHS